LKPDDHSIPVVDLFAGSGGEQCSQWRKNDFSRPDLSCPLAALAVAGIGNGKTEGRKKSECGRRCAPGGVVSLSGNTLAKSRTP